MNALSGSAHSSAHTTPSTSTSAGSFFQPAYQTSQQQQQQPASKPPLKSAPRSSYPSHNFGQQFAEQFFATNPQPDNPFSSVATMKDGTIPYNSLAYQYTPNVDQVPYLSLWVVPNYNIRPESKGKSMLKRNL